MDKKPWRTRVQIYDAPFGLKKTDAITLHVDGKASKIPSLKGNPVFDDSKNYFDKVQLDHGVKVPSTGTRITVLQQKGTSMKIRITS